MKLSRKIVVRIVGVLLLCIAISFGLQSISDKRQADADREKKKQEQMEQAMLREKQKEQERAVLLEAEKGMKDHKPKLEPPASLAGEYMVIIDSYSGDAEEKFILTRDGQAVWRWIESEKILESKFGTWESNKAETEITTKIMGKTGQIIETYTLKNAKFRSGDRYLKRVKPL